MSETGLSIQYTAVATCPDVERYDSMLVEFTANPAVTEITTEPELLRITVKWQDTDWRGWI